MNSFKRYVSIFLIALICVYFTSCKNNQIAKVITIPDNSIIVHFIDVGQGDSILIQGNNKNLLIDAGPKSKEVLSYLKKCNIKTLDYVVATHPHEDHIGGMSSVIHNFNIGSFYAPKKVANSESFKDMIITLKEKNLQITPARAGIKLNLGPNTTCAMLAPNSNSYEEINNHSVVLKLTYGKTSFLFTGDAETLSEDEILKNGFNIEADVLKVGHHGSKSSTSTNFLNDIKPKVALISCGKGNDYGHPHKETLIKLKNNDTILYRTDLDGTIILESDGSKIMKR